MRVKIVEKVTTEKSIELSESDLENILRDHSMMPTGKLDIELGGGNYLPCFTLTETVTINTPVEEVDA
jgi:hypothetical protein